MFSLLSDMPIFDFPEISKQEVCSIKIVIPGAPVPKGRHRARIVQPRFKPAFIHFYQDADTEAYEARVAQEAGLVMRGRGKLLGPLGVNVMAFVTIPESWSLKQKQRAIEGTMLPVTRPDADNYLKCCLDAMNGIVYKDDSQVVDMKVQKRYAEKPRLEIEIFAV